MKKKVLSIIALVALLATSLIVLAGCAADNKDSFNCVKSLLSYGDRFIDGKYVKLFI